MTKKRSPQTKTSKMSEQKRADSWSSMVTGLGTSLDKRTSMQVNWNPQNPEQWEQMYAGDEMGARIVDVVPEEALRQWVEWVGVKKEEAKQVEKVCQNLDLRSAVEKTWKWARAYGGAVLYVVTDTDQPGSPFKPGEKVIGLRDLSRYDLRVMTTDVESDFGSPNYGYPKVYYLNVQMGSQYKGYPIHASRVIRFDGKLVPRRTFIRNNYWHDSVFQRLYNVIRNYQSSNDAAASILQDFNVGVYKMKNLANLIGAGKESIVKSRLEILNYSKSVIRAMVLDADEEDFEDLSRNVTGLSELLQHQGNRLVAATDIPHTKLLGESPGGSNATGNSTTSQWYDHIQSEQENYLRPKIKRLMDMLFPESKKLDFKFKKLWQLDEAQEADLRNKQAQTDAVYISSQVLDPSEVAQSRFGGDVYSTETKLDLEARAMGEINPESGGLESEEDNGPLGEDGLPATPDDASSKEFSGPAPYEPERSVDFNNKTIPLKTPKAEPIVSQTMSEPMRDPKTDPKMKAPGMPNRPRTIISEEFSEKDK